MTPLLLRGLLIAFLLLLLLCAVQAVSTLFVTPSSNTTCGGEPCLTLNQYAENSSQYFTDDTELVFLSGRHLLDGFPVTVINVTRFVMRTESNIFNDSLYCEIVCRASAVAFINVGNVTISNLAFNHCGDSTPSVLAVDVQTLEVVDSRFSDSPLSALFTLHSQAIISGCIFENNFSGQVGGAIRTFNSTMRLQDCQFINNTASFGGAVDATSSVLKFYGSNSFVENKATQSGGSIFTLRSDLSFSGTNIFCRNFAKMFGGAIHSISSNCSFSGVANFSRNLAPLKFIGAGAAIQAIRSSIWFNGSAYFVQNGPSFTNGAVGFVGCNVLMEGIVVFDSNVACIISAMDVTDKSNVTLSGLIVFNNNSAQLVAGAVDVYQSSLVLQGNIVFSRNSIEASSGVGAAAISVAEGNVTVIGISNFIANVAGIGTAVYLLLGRVEFRGSHHFESNTAEISGGVVRVVNGTVSFTGDGHFANNSADVLGGTLHAISGHFIFNGNMSFMNNRAPSGGALYLEYSSLLSLMAPSQLVFKENSAERGGAIFVSDTSNSVLCFNESFLTFSVDLSMCFFLIEPSTSVGSVTLTFENNTVSTPDGGESIFGGMLDKCIPSNEPFTKERGLSLLKKVIKDKDNFDISTISSEPIRLCFCVAGIPDCDYQPPTFSIVRGETITLSVVALNQVSQTVSASIQGIFPSTSAVVSDFGEGQAVQQVDASCTNLDYTILTSATQVTFTVYAQGPCSNIGNAKQVSVTLRPCPLAFELSESKCICAKKLQRFTNSCNIDSKSFQRNGNFWIGSDYNNGSYVGLVIQPHCPFDYCQSDTADINVNDLDSQCAFSREGVLCGSCQGNLSLSLGSSRCMECSNSYLALLIPFAVAGIVLVLLLFLLRLTVSVGTLSGLIFYANIVAVNRSIFFPPGATNVLTVFIAWLNLDFGIETCFYSGMDTYGRTWLQFVFPVFTVLLAVLIILGSHYLKKFPKILSRNPVSVLATFVLLSYAKVLRTIITVFSSTSLEYPNNNTQTIWLYDGNVKYLRGKHIPLFVVSLVLLVFLFLPYTLLIVFGHLVQGLSNNRISYWLSRFGANVFLDAYYSPYIKRHRYWPGALLLMRCALFLVFSVNALGSPSVNLLTISSASLGLALISRFSSQIHSQRFLDILEGSFILNLGVLAAATHHVMQAGGNQAAVTYLSVSIAFAEFLGIVIYHAYLQIKETKAWRKSARVTMHKQSNSILGDRISYNNTTPSVTVTELNCSFLEPAT